MREDPRLLSETYRNRLAPNDGWIGQVKDWFESVRPILLDGAPREVASHRGALVWYEEYRKLVGAEDADAEVRQRFFAESPEQLYELADHAFTLLSRPVNDLSSADRRLRRHVEGSIRNGTIPSAGASFEQLTDAAPGGSVARVLLTPLAGSLAGGESALSARIEQRFGSLDSASAAVLATVSAQQSQIDSISASLRRMADGQARREAQVRRDALIQETRAGVYVTSTLLGLVDPEVGRIVGETGDASLDAGIATASLLQDGFSFAATGNLLGAGLRIAQALGPSRPDAGAQRHAQVVRMLAQIGKQLEEVQRTLHIVDAKVDVVIREVQAIREGQVEQTETLTRTIHEMRDHLLVAAGRGRHDVTEQYLSAHATRRDECLQVFPLRGPEVRNPNSAAGLELTKCLQNYVTYGLDHGRRAAFTYADFRWGADELAELSARDPIHYLRVLPAIVSELRSASGAEFLSVTAAGSPALSHPEVAAGAINDLVELRLRQPRYRFDREREHLLELRGHLENYRVWSTQALARSQEADGGGLLAFEGAKADVLAILRAMEARYLEAREQNGRASPLADFCRMILRSAALADLESCARDRPRLTESLAGMAPLNLARYAAHHGRYEARPHTWNWDPYTQPHFRKPYGHDGDKGNFYYLNEPFCVTRTELFSRQIPTGRDTLLLMQGVRKCAHFEFQHPRKREVENALNRHLDAQVASLASAPEQWSPDLRQRWFTTPNFAAAKTEAVLAPLRREFALQVAADLQNSERSDLREALTRLDRVQFAWRAYEQLALGACFGAETSNFERLRTRGAVLPSTLLTQRLAGGDLLGFARGITPLSAELRADLPLSRVPEQRACPTIPPFVSWGIDAVNRYLALRSAAG